MLGSRTIFVLGVLLVVSNVALADEFVDYERTIKPILRERCYACHGALKQEGSLRLDTAALAVEGGDSGSAIEPGEADQSLLVERIESDADRMPPEGSPLTDEQKKWIRRWVSEGARSPMGEAPQAPPNEHWAYRAIRAKYPSRPLSGSRNMLDGALGGVHESEGVSPAPEANRATLLRRVTIDLIGVPPTPAELSSFLEDERPDAFERVVDRLLADPRYGERWGRHWMDVWRYSDWSGEKNNQVRGSPKHIWRWRDWIVESLNHDLGYDAMVRQMLAADELTPNDPARLRATGFLARNWYKFNRNVWLADTVEHTAKAFLGVTMECAKCHDHKYDPIRQVDFYRFRAIFEPHDVRTDQVNGEKDLEKDGLVRVYDAKLDTPTYVFERGQESRPDKTNTVKPGVPGVLGGGYAIPEVAETTGRRAALARWITSSENPLTPRVAVNHVWHRHFGAPLVESMTDFGLRAPRPDLLPVLDLLSAELVARDWSMKQLQRAIVTSSAYRRRSANTDCPSREVDPNNRLVWRQNVRRMEGEAVRDSALHLAGNLDRRMGGPEIALEEATTSRRASIYFRHGHERQAPLVKVFDGASVLECYRRNQTIVPQQALALANSVVIREQSRRIARTTNDRTSSDTEFVNEAYMVVLCRPPSDRERLRCLQFLQAQEKLFTAKGLTFPDNSPEQLLDAATSPELRAREGLIHVLLNHNDFVAVR